MTTLVVTNFDLLLIRASINTKEDTVHRWRLIFVTTDVNYINNNNRGTALNQA